VRTRVEEVSVQGRNTQGVRVIRTRDGEALVSVSRIAEDDIDAPDTTEVVSQAAGDGAQAEPVEAGDASGADSTPADPGNEGDEDSAE
jgi:DNA gyrase subunit A